MHKSRLTAVLLGVGAAASLVVVGAAPSYAAYNVKCNDTSTGLVCVGYDPDIPEVKGAFINDAANSHTGHLDLIRNSKIVVQCSPHTIPVNGSAGCGLTNPASGTWRSDWVNSNGTHFKSPNVNVP